MTWTTVHPGAPDQAPYLLAWVDIDGAGTGLLGRFVDQEQTALRSGLPVLVRHTADQPFAKVFFTVEAQR